MSIASLTKGASSAYCWATSAGPDPLVIEPVEGERHSFTVVWLHGIGASAKDSKKVMSKMAAKLPSAKFVCPEAPTRLMKAQNFVMRAWWDINKMNLQVPSRPGASHPRNRSVRTGTRSRRRPSRSCTSSRPR